MCCSLCHIPHMPFLWGEKLADSFWCQITEECAGGFVFSCLATYQLARAGGMGRGSSKRKGSWASFLSYHDFFLAYLVHFPLAFSFSIVHFPLSVKILRLLCDYCLCYVHLALSSSFLFSQEWLLLFHFFFLRVYDWLTPCSLCLSCVAGATRFWNAGSGVDCRVLNEKHTFPC